MAIPKDVKNILNKIFQAVREDPNKLITCGYPYWGRDDERAYTIENLETLASNHLFDDHHELYGITELEGCIVRSYFQTGAETYDFFKDLREEFPDFFKTPDTQEYLDDTVNYCRERKGLEKF